MSENKHQRRDGQRAGVRLDWEDTPPAGTTQQVKHGDVPSLEITLRQAEALVEVFGGHDALVSVIERPEAWSNMDPGLYAYFSEYPEEGSLYLGPTDVDDDLAMNGRAPAAPVRTWRERLGLHADFPLHVPSNVEWAMEAEIAELRARVGQLAAPVPAQLALLDVSELAALRRFNETCEDGEGYDVPKEMMQRLAGIGAVRRTSGSYYEITEFGMYVLEQPAPTPVPIPFLPMPAHRVDELLLAHGSIEESRWGAENPKQYHTGLLGASNLVRAVEQEVQGRFAVLGNCRRCEARGTYAGWVNKQLTSVPCDDCGGTGKTPAAMQAQRLKPAAADGVGATITAKREKS